ncbi:hypothetical protein ACOMHN_029543 [Nucella lapillus]
MVGLRVNHLSFTSIFLLLQLSARSVPYPAREFPEVSVRKSRQAPGRINCSDCKPQHMTKPHHMTKRIRQMQHLERMKQRIMSAIRSNGKHVPINEAARPLPKVTEGQKIRGQAWGSEAGSAQNTSDAASGVGGAGRTRSLQQNGTQKGQPDPRASGTTHPTPISPPDRSSLAADKTLSPGPGATHLRGGDKANERKGSRVAVLEAKGPNIVSFSRIVSSGKRKHVLQFTLKPMTPGDDLEVVKAHLWLLLTRSPPHDDLQPKDPHLHGKVQSGKEESDSARSPGRSRSGGNPPRIVANKKGAEKTNGSSKVENVPKKPNPKERQKRSSLPSFMNKTSHQSGRKSRRGKTQKRVQQQDDLEDDENDDDRFQAVLRILLLANNGTRTLMTYLRTNVKVTHWQKVRLPVSVIQKQLQSSQNTLTLLIRCRRCGDTVQMVLPRQRRSKSRRKERRRKQRRKDREKKRSSRREKKKRGHHQKRRKRRHGVQGRKGMEERKKRRRQFRPLPFLVINTRLRPNRESSA